MTSGEKVATVAALYVDPRGCYAGLESVEVWDEQRDARTYAGPWPVVAHPPCERWSVLAGLVEATHGYKRGDDGGCFAKALDAVRRWGGVLEHPANSAAFEAHGLNRPGAVGWIAADFEGGWVCTVYQSRHGHLWPKPTWLYAHGVELPAFDGMPDKRGVECKRCGSMTAEPKSGYCLACAGGGRRHHTPEAFRDILLGMARSAR